MEVEANGEETTVMFQLSSKGGKVLHPCVCVKCLTEEKHLAWIVCQMGIRHL